MTEKTILLCGVLDNENSTNIPMSIAFMKKGFKVIPINYRTVISRYGAKYFNGYLMSAVHKYSPELILFSKCNGINPEIVKKCTDITKTWLWNMDAKPTIERCMEVVYHAKFATYASCTSEETSKWFEEEGVGKCYTLFEGVDLSLYKPVEEEDSYKCDISFIGTRTEERDNFKKLLLNKGYDARFYGPGYTGEVFNTEFCKICSSSKVMLSLNVHNNIPNYFSDRVFRYMACKAPVFHWDSTGTLEKWFRNNKEIFYFTNESDLLDLLENKDLKLTKVAEAGYKKILKEHTWDSVITNILTIAELI